MIARRWPIHGWVGLTLVTVFWPVHWTLEGMRTRWGFFSFELFALYHLLAGLVGRCRDEYVLPAQS